MGTIVQKKKEVAVEGSEHSNSIGVNGNLKKNLKGTDGSPKTRAQRIFDDENSGLLHSPYSARRNPAFGSTSSINTAEIGHAEIRTTGRDSPSLIFSRRNRPKHYPVSPSTMRLLPHGICTNDSLNKLRNLPA